MIANSIRFLASTRRSGLRFIICLGLMSSQHPTAFAQELDTSIVLLLYPVDQRVVDFNVDYETARQMPHLWDLFYHRARPIATNARPDADTAIPYHASILTFDISEVNLADSQDEIFVTFDAPGRDEPAYARIVAVPPLLADSQLVGAIHSPAYLASWELFLESNNNTIHVTRAIRAALARNHAMIDFVILENGPSPTAVAAADGTTATPITIASLDVWPPGSLPQGIGDDASAGIPRDTVDSSVAALLCTSSCSVTGSDGSLRGDNFCANSTHICGFFETYTVTVRITQFATAADELATLTVKFQENDGLSDDDMCSPQTVPFNSNSLNSQYYNSSTDTYTRPFDCRTDVCNYEPIGDAEVVIDLDVGDGAFGYDDIGCQSNDIPVQLCSECCSSADCPSSSPHCVSESCEQCVVASDCPNQTCKNSSCVNNSCVYTNQSSGTFCGSSSSSDCDAPDTCNGSGSCIDRVDPAGTSCSDDGNSCTNDQCNGSSKTCQHPNKQNGTSCGSGSNTACDNPDTCQNGSCQNNYEPSGFSCGSSSSSDCDAPDSCNGSGTCVDRVDPSGTPCVDDGNQCTNDQCNGSSKTCQHPNKQNGTSCGSPGNTECDDPDTCQNGSCSINYDAPGTPCGNSSSSGCDAPDTCNGSGTCIDRVDPSGTSCPDDGQQCTDDQCNGSSKTCQHPNKSNGSTCDPGQFCGECQSGTCEESCGDGFCDSSCGEDCDTCVSDCGCGSCDQCIGGTCVGNCGNGTCEIGCGEDCNNCAADCGCPSGQQCMNGSCQPTGECCVETSCTITTQASCSGSWTTGGDCTDGCPDEPIGSCCTGTSCSITTDANCTGQWTQDGTCLPNNPCVPDGECCDGGSCSVTKQADCTGSWTSGGDCSGTPCGCEEDTDCMDCETCVAGRCEDVACGTCEQCDNNHGCEDDPDPCCGSSEACCGNPDPCCGNPNPCCGNPNPCCGVDCDDNQPCTTDSCNSTDGSCSHVPVECGQGQTCDPTTDACVSTGSCCVGTSCSVTTEANCFGTWAIGGDCSPNPCTCDNDNDCPSNECCFDGECVPAECIADGDCDDGDACNGQETCEDCLCDAGPTCEGRDMICCDGECCVFAELLACNPSGGICPPLPPEPMQPNQEFTYEAEDIEDDQLGAIYEFVRWEVDYASDSYGDFVQAEARLQFVPEGSFRATRVYQVLDCDEDGVPDGIDECPGSSIGTQVDERGCPGCGLGLCGAMCSVSLGICVLGLAGMKRRIRQKRAAR